MYAYQTDGLSLSEKIHKIKKYFNRVYVFDEDDLRNNKDFFPSTNFWFADAVLRSQSK